MDISDGFLETSSVMVGGTSGATIREKTFQKK